MSIQENIPSDIRSDMEELLSLSTKEIEERGNISGKKGKEGITFIVPGRSGRKYAIKTFKKKKAASNIKKEFDLQHLASTTGASPKVYAYHPAKKYIIMEKMDRTIIEALGKQTAKINLDIKLEQQIYALCHLLDQAGVVQNDGNPLNLMFGDNGRLYIIDFGFGKKITKAVIKKRGKQPNINLTLWHLNSNLKHYKILTPNLKRIADTYVKEFKNGQDYTDTEFLKNGLTTLRAASVETPVARPPSRTPKAPSKPTVPKATKKRPPTVPKAKKRLAVAPRPPTVSKAIPQPPAVPIAKKRKKHQRTPVRKSKQQNYERHRKILSLEIGQKIRFYFDRYKNIFSGRFVKKNANGTFTITYKLKGKRVPLIITKEDFRF